MSRLRVFLLIVSLALSHARFLGSPEPMFSAYCPKGLKIILPDEHYMGHIQIIFGIDKPGNAGQYEYYANKEVYEKKGGEWVYEDKQISLSQGQTMFYKINQIISPSMKRTLYEGAHVFQYFFPSPKEDTKAQFNSTEEIKSIESSSITDVDAKNSKDISSSANAENCSCNSRSSSKNDNELSSISTSSSSDNCRCNAQSMSDPTKYSNSSSLLLPLKEPQDQTLVDGRKLKNEIQDLKMKLNLLTNVVSKLSNQTQIMHSALQRMAAQKNFTSSLYTEHLRDASSEPLNGYNAAVRPSPASTNRLWFSARYYSQSPQLACTLFKWLFPDCASIDSFRN